MFLFRGDHFQFGSVRFLSKKVTKSNFFKKNQNRTETGSNQPVLVWFLGQKLIQTGLARFFSSFFCLGSVWFFWFQTYKTEPNRSVFSKF
jgi:hypothetical protein